MRNDFEMGKNRFYRAISRKGLKIFITNKKERRIKLQKRFIWKEMKTIGRKLKIYFSTSSKNDYFEWPSSTSWYTGLIVSINMRETIMCDGYLYP